MGFKSIDFRFFDEYKSMILRLSLGVAVALWGFGKISFFNVINQYIVHYGRFMVINVELFLKIAGYSEVALAVLLLAGLFTRVSAAIVTLMGIVTIIIPGIIVMRDLLPFAHAFVLTGAGLALFIEGSGDYSVDKMLFKNKKIGKYLLR